MWTKVFLLTVTILSAHGQIQRRQDLENGFGGQAAGNVLGGQQSGEHRELQQRRQFHRQPQGFDSSQGQFQRQAQLQQNQQGFQQLQQQQQLQGFQQPTEESQQPQHLLPLKQARFMGMQRKQPLQVQVQPQLLEPQQQPQIFEQPPSVRRQQFTPFLSQLPQNQPQQQPLEQGTGFGFRQQQSPLIQEQFPSALQQQQNLGLQTFSFGFERMPMSKMQARPFIQNFGDFQPQQQKRNMPFDKPMMMNHQMGSGMMSHQMGGGMNLRGPQQQLGAQNGFQQVTRNGFHQPVTSPVVTQAVLQTNAPVQQETVTTPPPQPQPQQDPAPLAQQEHQPQPQPQTPEVPTVPVDQQQTPTAQGPVAAPEAATPQQQPATPAVPEPSAASVPQQPTEVIALAPPPNKPLPQPQVQPLELPIPPLEAAIPPQAPLVQATSALPLFQPQGVPERPPFLSVQLSSPEPPPVIQTTPVPPTPEAVPTAPVPILPTTTDDPVVFLPPGTPAPPAPPAPPGIRKRRDAPDVQAPGHPIPLIRVQAELSPAHERAKALSGLNVTGVQPAANTFMKQLKGLSDLVKSEPFAFTKNDPMINLVNSEIDLAVSNWIFNEEIAGEIALTFGIARESAGRTMLLTPADVDELVIHGNNPTASKKFRVQLAELLWRKIHHQYRVTTDLLADLSDALLGLLSGNGLIREKFAEDISGFFYRTAKRKIALF